MAGIITPGAPWQACGVVVRVALVDLGAAIHRHIGMDMHVVAEVRRGH
jgi:hypothetical protein